MLVKSLNLSGLPLSCLSNGDSKKIWLMELLWGVQGSRWEHPQADSQNASGGCCDLRSSFLGLATWFSSCVWGCWNSFLCHLCVTGHCPQDLPAGTAAYKLEAGSRAPLSSHLRAERPASRGHPAARWSPTARCSQPCSCVPAKQKHLFPFFFPPLSHNSLPHTQVRSHRAGPGGDVSDKLSSISESPFRTVRHFLGSHFCPLMSPIWKVSSVRETLHYILQTRLLLSLPHTSAPRVLRRLTSFLFQMQVSETEPRREF